MTRTIAYMLIAVTAASGCRGATVESGGMSRPGAASVPTSDYVPVGTRLEVRLNQTLDTDNTVAGDRFTSTIEQAVVARNGVTVIPRGATVRGTVTEIDDSDNVGDQAVIRLDFEQIEISGRRYPFSAEVTDTDVDVDDSGRLGDVAKRAGIGAAIGAVLGAVVGGDRDDVLKGAAIGAGAGTVISLGTGDVDASLPAGTMLMLQTRSPITLR